MPGKLRTGGRIFLIPGEMGRPGHGFRQKNGPRLHSMAEVVRCKMVGIIMTGMGQDGAAGLLEMRKKGAYVPWAECPPAGGA